MASVNSKETEELWQLRVVDLRAKLARRGLNKSGLKHELIECLAKSILGESSKSNETCSCATTETCNLVAITGQGSEQTTLNEAELLPTLVLERVNEFTGESSELSEAVEDQNFKNERATISQDNCTKCKDFTIEMAEFKLELAMLWALVNTKQTTSLKNVTMQTVNDPPKKQPELPSKGQALPRSHISKSWTDFKNQLNSYGSANKEKFEIQNVRQVKKQVKNQEKTEKKSKWLQNNELANVKYKLREAEQERESLKTAVKILKDDLTQALSTKEDKEDHRPWQVIKPNSTIDIRSKNKRNSNSPTTESPKLSTTNQFSMIDDQLTPTPMVINVDNDEHANETCAIDFKGDERSSIKTKRANSSNKSAGDKEHDNSKANHSPNNTTVIIGDSLLKNLRQQSIGKATKSKVQVKCFPDARLQDMKYYSVPALSAKPKHIVVHCGTNDLKNKKPEEIVKETNELCQLLQKESPESDITVSSIIHRKDNQGSKVDEVNNLSKSLCIGNNFRFLLHQNIDLNCLNRSGLHLNKLGDCTLAKNIIGAIKCF